jgi:hypothetical protein
MDSVADGKVLVYPTKESHPDYIFIDKACKHMVYASRHTRKVIACQAKNAGRGMQKNESDSDNDEAE